MSIRIIYRDSENIQREGAVYGTSEYVSTYSLTSMNKPVKTNSEGMIDASLLKGGTASLVSLERKAATYVQEGDVVRPYSDTHVMPATYNGIAEEAMAIAIALSSAAPGEDIEIAVFGIITKSMYEVFPVNRPLYLEENGAITDERPVTGYLVPVGKSLGHGAIMIDISYPTKLGV